MERITVRICLTSEPEMRPSASQILQNNIFYGMKQRLINQTNSEIGYVSMINQIKCPKVLKLLNSRLPKPCGDQKQKTVTFASRQQMQKCKFSIFKQNYVGRIRSQKIIKWFEEDSIKVSKIAQKKIFKKGSDQQDNSDKKIKGYIYKQKIEIKNSIFKADS